VRDEGFDRIISETEAETRFFDWGDRVYWGDNEFDIIVELLSPTPLSLIMCMDIVELGRRDYDDRFGRRLRQVRNSRLSEIELEREWMRHKRLREKVIFYEGDGWNKDVESEIIKRERKEGWRELMWEEWSEGDRPVTKEYMIWKYIRIDVNEYNDIHYTSNEDNIMNILFNPDMEVEVLFD
jgi:hypothetical protein